MKTRIDVILANLEDIFIKNPTITSEEIYSMLIRNGILDKKYFDIEYPINENFKDWKKHYKRSKTQAYTLKNNDYFCYFEKGEVDVRKAIKLYIPMNARGINEGVKELFDYMENNNIAHKSKVGSFVRNDDVVVRVDSLADVLKIIDFVARNDKIKAASIEPSVFTFSVNGIGLALDSHCSYNSFVASVLLEYMKTRYNAKPRVAPNSMEFSKFIAILSAKENDHTRKAMYNELLKIVNHSMNMQTFIDDVNFYQENDRLLENILIETNKKYGKDHTEKALMAAANQGTYKYLTNEYKLRTKANKYLSSLQVRSIMQKRIGYNINAVSESDASDYMEKIQYLQARRNGLYDALVYGIFETILKLDITDPQDVYKLVQKFADDHNLKYITRTNNAREIVDQTISYDDDIYMIIRKKLALDNSVSDDEVLNIFVSEMLAKQKRR